MYRGEIGFHNTVQCTQISIRVYIEQTLSPDFQFIKSIECVRESHITARTGQHSNIIAVSWVYKWIIGLFVKKYRRLLMQSYVNYIIFQFYLYNIVCIASIIHWVMNR